MDLFQLFVMGVLVSFFFKSFHLLSFLIGLEMLVMLIFFYFVYNHNFFSFYILLFYVAITACESALGLILFVYFNRYFSKDYIMSLGLMKF